MAARVTDALGTADIRIRDLGEERFPDSVLSRLEREPDALLIVPRTTGPVPLRSPRTFTSATVVARGILPEREYRLTEPNITEGRRVERDGEMVLDPDTAERLGVSIGNRLEVVRFGDPIVLQVVGIAARPAIDLVIRPEATLTSPTLAAITGYTDQLSEALVILDDGADPESFAARLGADLGPRIVVEATTRITSGIAAAVKANQFVFILASILSYIAAAFIVLTGLTTNMLERRRELAILRCIGGTRTTLALAQLGVGGLVGIFGAAIGVPFGVFLAWCMAALFPERLPSGLVVPASGLLTAALGAIGAGLIGALWPAFAAARTPPLESLSVRAVKPRPGLLGLALTGGLIGLLVQAMIVGLSNDGQTLFWGYALIGLPAMFMGYFLLGVPLSWLIARALGPILSKVLRLPGSLLVGTMTATPFRNGFTAGALMVGLAMMTAIWTNGSAVLRDWLGSIDFPAAFVHGWLGLTPEIQRNIEDLDFVSQTCAITLHRISDDTFGVRAFHGGIGTTFVAFEPEPFFEMTRLTWIDGDEATARSRLAEGGAILIAREFKIAGGYQLGDTYTVRAPSGEVPFEIVGVISSPGLDLVNKYFDIGKEYANQAVHSVFGTREDLKQYFNDEAIHLIQIGVQGDLSDEEINRRIRGVIGQTPAVVGSGREILEGVLEIGRGSMRIATIVAFAAMLIGSLGVGNIMIAGIDARRFQFGVLRAVGAERGLISRMLVGEVLLIALTACVLGTALGLQGCWAGIRLNRLLAGLELRFVPQIAPIALGWLLLVLLALAVVGPIIWRISRTKARMLLASVKG